MLLHTELHPYHHQPDNGLHGWATPISNMVHHRRVRHPTTAHYGMRGSIGQLTRYSVEVEAEAEDIKAATRIVTVHPGTIGETAEVEVVEADIAAVMVEGTRVTGLATTRMTTADC